MSLPSVRIERLSKIFLSRSKSRFSLSSSSGPQHKVVALDNLSLEIAAGEIFMLLGCNGAGKTTLLKILAGLILPDEGQYEILGLDGIRNPAQVKKLFSLVLSNNRGFYERLTGRENLEFFATLYGLNRRETLRRITQAEAWLQLDLDKPYQQYSMGNRQRLALARGFLHEAQIFLMDEPTRSLDPPAVFAFWEIIRHLAREGKTAICTTQYLEEAEAFADRVAILDRGQLRACGTVEEICQQNSVPSQTLRDLFQQMIQRETLHA